MTEEEFFKKVSYAIDTHNKKMTVFFEKTPIKTLSITKNLSYNLENEDLSHIIALNSKFADNIKK